MCYIHSLPQKSQLIDKVRRVRVTMTLSEFCTTNEIKQQQKSHHANFITLYNNYVIIFHSNGATKTIINTINGRPLMIMMMMMMARRKKNYKTRKLSFILCTISMYMS